MQTTRVCSGLIADATAIPFDFWLTNSSQTARNRARPCSYAQGKPAVTFIPCCQLEQEPISVGCVVTRLAAAPKLDTLPHRQIQFRGRTTSRLARKRSSCYMRWIMHGPLLVALSPAQVPAEVPPTSVTAAALQGRRPQQLSCVQSATVVCTSSDALASSAIPHPTLARVDAAQHNTAQHSTAHDAHSSPGVTLYVARKSLPRRHANKTSTNERDNTRRHIFGSLFAQKNDTS